MKELEIKHLYSSDVDDLAAFRPPDAAAIFFPVEMSIGFKGEQSSSIFSAVVATPEGLGAHHVHPRAEKTKYVVISHYSWEGLKEKLEGIVKRCSCDDYDAAAEKLRAYFNWEYE